jgi:beta-lactamase superfamily II metal-dependent hydrolase
LEKSEMPADRHSNVVILRRTNRVRLRVSTCNTFPGLSDGRALLAGGTASPGCARFPKLSGAFATATLALLIFFFGQFANAADAKSLQIYFIDVEGGQATLFVTPERQSLLIDTGWSGNNGRDAERIVAAAHDAGIHKIDFVLITHYHDDHVGGVPQLAERIPIGTFIDHGENREPTGEFSQKVFAAYQQLLATGKYQRIVAKPGDVLPIKGIRAEVITSDGAMIEKPLAGAGQPNPYCANSPVPQADDTENPRSLGTLITFGELRILDLGDLTADKERALMCPVNRLGGIDIYIASHHGNLQSGSAALVHALMPAVAVIDNGAKKGGSPTALEIIKTTSRPRVDLWQLHFSEEAGAEHNTGSQFIANLQGPDAGNFLKITAQSNRTFTIFNSRTSKSAYYDFAEKPVTLGAR